jgi:alpha-tubulin suppressor-like RCC1 family protein
MVTGTNRSAASPVRSLVAAVLVFFAILWGLLPCCSKDTRNGSNGNDAGDTDTDTDTDTGTGTDSDTDESDAGSDSGEPFVPVFLSIGGGNEHTCALESSGGVACWGADGVGQHGDGAVSVGPGMTWAVDLPSEVEQLEVLKEHACVLEGASDPEKTDARLWCWGKVEDGGWGDFPEEVHLSPSPVDGLYPQTIAHAAGAEMHCALSSGGAVQCWGRNYNGHLGDGTYEASVTPMDVVGLGAGVRLIGAGWFHACAVTEDAGVWCWGDNWAGQLGDGVIGGTSNVPVQVAGLTGMEDEIAKIDCGAASSCVLTTSGDVYCWGIRLGIDGDGDGSPDESDLVPTPVEGFSDPVVDISLGIAHGCALTAGGGVQCWGSNQGGFGDPCYGQLGNDSCEWSSVPVDVVGLDSGVVAIGVGGMHSCAVKAAGDAWCWGWNEQGQLGDGTTENSGVPVSVVGPEE